MSVVNMHECLRKQKKSCIYMSVILTSAYAAYQQAASNPAFMEKGPPLDVQQMTAQVHKCAADCNV